MEQYPVIAGMVYTLDLSLGCPGDVAQPAAVCLAFHDVHGAPVDAGLLTAQYTLPHLDPIMMEASPARGAGIKRIFVPPPDAVTVTITPQDGAHHVHSAKVAQCGFAAIRAGLGFTSHGPDRLIVEQLDVLRKQLHPAATWAPILEKMAVGIDDADDLKIRQDRLRAARPAPWPVAFVGRARTYEHLRCISDVFWLDEMTYADQLDVLRPKVVLIELCHESGPGDWNGAFGGLDGTLPPQGQAVFDAAHARGIPVHIHAGADAKAHQKIWHQALMQADRVIVTGADDDWMQLGLRDVQTTPTTVEPAAAPAALQHERTPDLMVVPVGSDIFEYPAFADLLREQSLFDVFITEAHYGFGLKALAPRLAPATVNAASDLHIHQHSHLMQQASIVLLNGQSIRNAAQMHELILDAITAGAIPVMFGPVDFDMPVIDLLPKVTSLDALIALQAQVRIGWWRERLWRGLHLYVMRHHRMLSVHRRALLTSDCCAADYDTPCISVVLVSKRPSLMAQCLATFRAQSWPNTELIIVLHGDHPADTMPALNPNEQLFTLSKDNSIGRAINLGIETATGQFWTKMDDDDAYCDSYLEEYVYYYHATQADSLVCQGVYFYFEGTDETWGRVKIHNRAFYKHHHLPQAMGPTLSARKGADVPLMSDSQRNSVDALWMRHVAQSGTRSFVYDTTSCVIFRSADEAAHTWKMTGRSDLMRQLERICAGHIAPRLRIKG